MTVKVKKNEPSEQWSSGVWSAVRLDSVIFFEAVRDLCAVIVDQPGLEQRRRDEPLAVDQCRQFHIVVLDTELPPADRAGNRLSGPEMMMPILLPTTWDLRNASRSAGFIAVMLARKPRGVLATGWSPQTCRSRMP